MATYTLSGTGVQALSPAVVGLHVAVTVVPAGSSIGSDNPPQRYQVGLLRPGNGAGWYEEHIPVIGSQWIRLGSGVLSLGYSIFGSGVITVDEVF